MRVMLTIKLPHEPFNTAVRDGSAGAKIRKILAEQKPEATYFTEIDGHRTGILVVELPEASKIPSFAEPWFLTFQADVNFRIVMTPEDLGKSDLDAMGKKW